MFKFLAPILRVQWLLAVPLLLAAGYGAFMLFRGGALAPRTDGTIFIETPQIYTRERLVNDRFVQESWLRDVLRKDVSFTPSEVVSITDQAKRSLQVDLSRGGGSSGGNPPANASAADQPGGATGSAQAPPIPPPLYFLMQNAYRELVRGQLIENQLDDRHDIRGTTIYLLKFDVSVIPGNNTRKPAFVHVHIARGDAAGAGASEVAGAGPNPGAGGGNTGKSAPASAARSKRPRTAEEYFFAYVDNPSLFAGFAGAEENPVLQDYELYNQWRSSLKDRLNNALWDLLRRFDANSFRFGEYTDFLSMLAEKSDKDRFSKAAIRLSRLRDMRDKVRGKFEKDAPAAGVVALDHRFHFLAKLILTKAAESPDAAAPDDPEPAVKDVEDMLVGNATLPPSAEEGKLREALLSYAVRRIGIAVVGDSSLKVGKLQAQAVQCPERSATPSLIQSKTLDRFVSILLCDPPGARTLPELDLVARQADLFSFHLKEVEQLLTPAQAKSSAGGSAPEANKCAIADGQSFGFTLRSTYPARVDERDPVKFELGAFRSDASAGTDDSLLPPYIFKPQNLHRAFANVQAAQDLTPHSTCLSSAKGISLPVGFLNFVNQIVDMQTYTYATLPRIDLLVGDTASDVAQSDALAVDGKTAGASGGLSNYYRRVVRAVAPQSSAVGFSGPLCSKAASLGCENTGATKEDLSFGWILSPPTDTKDDGGIRLHRPMLPTQRSLSGLITVPTWWKKAQVQVTTGWVNDDGTFDVREESTTSRPYSIPLPIDYESLDALLTEPGRRDSRKPSISLERLPENLFVQACERAEILIPGHRLWRSSVVVLGGQRADEVAVLPDMRGIVATFKPVNGRAEWEKDDRAMRPLQVWTSEGVAGPLMVTVAGGNNTCPAEQAPKNPALPPTAAANR
jgi:hypothetical protein